jgi:hypothetical protein
MSDPHDPAVAAPPAWAAALRLGRAWLAGGWRTAHGVAPDVWHNLQRELLAARP